MQHRLVDQPNLALQLQSLLPFFAEHDIGPNNMRLRAYRDFAEDLATGASASYEAAHFAALHKELHELTFVFTTLRQMKAAIPSELLRKCFTGEAIATGDPESDRGRTYLLQLRAALYFLLANYSILLDQECDLIAQRGRVRFFVECKRLYSVRKVCLRLREASNQIVSRFKTAPRFRGLSRGIAWLDPSPILQQHFDIYSTYSRAGAGDAARRDLFEFHRTSVVPCRRVDDKRIIGLVLQYLWPSLTRRDEPVVTGFTTLVLPSNREIGLLDSWRMGRLYRSFLPLNVVQE